MADNISPVSPRNARFAGIQNNVRSFLREMPTPSSLYSRSPNPNHNDEESPGTIPSYRGFLNRSRIYISPSANSSASHLPLNPQGMGLTGYSPAPQPSEWGRHPINPAPAVLSDRHAADTAAAPALFDHPDIEEQAREAHRRKRKKRRRRRHPPNAWVRPHRASTKKKKQGGCVPLFHGRTRTKALWCIISGLFLTTVLTIYLTIALAVKGISLEIHILFILTILATMIFFVYSLIRLCVMARGPRSRRTRNAIPSVVGPEGFTPPVPIRVHLAQDEELAAQAEDGAVEEKLEALKAPPPAYGLWRCSVRVNPDLLHWQRVEGAEHPEDANSRTGSPTQRQSSANARQPPAEPQQRQVPRPPSYASDDGVEYIVSAQPRNTVFFPAPTSEIHPAYRDCVRG